MSTAPQPPEDNLIPIHEPDSDTALISRLRAREEAALLSIYDRYSSLSYGVILQVTHDEGAAEEMMQDVFLQLWRRPEMYDPARGALGAWITVVSRHKAIDALRRRRPEIGMDGVDISIDCTQEDHCRCAETIGKVREVLTLLPMEQRTAFELAYFHGFSHSEICRQTGEPLGTVKSRVRAALAAVRNAFLGRAA